ncbi:MAG: DUF937 domain-containing protein [Saprospiraceae bacterium]|nr:DUF937 domain-containing protein [Bacteroidia bacterium]NNK89461.1 DUF937 domain-containing protein [Saprospiraceae bacterium]
MDLMDLLQWQLSDGVLNGLDNQLNIGDSKKTNAAASAAMSVLMTALSKNAASSDSALNGLSGALERDHDGSFLDDIMGLMTGKSQPQNAKQLNGAGILGHLLGGKQDSAIEVLARMAGLDKNQSMGMLVKLAPMVLGVLGRYKKQKQMDNDGLRSFLNRSQEVHVERNEGANIFTKLLDKDGDGSVVDEVASIGMKMLGNFLRR